MKDRELQEKLGQALNHAAPNDFENILPRIDTQQGAVKKNKRGGARRWTAVAACLALLVLCGGAGTAYYQVHAVASVISVDVNPSIQLETNKNQQVLSCKALNEDAKKVLSQMDGGEDLEGVKLEVAMNALVGALVRNGYLDSVSSAILISVEDSDTERAAQIQKELSTSVDAALQNQKTDTQVLTQQIENNEALKKQAEENHISVGKAQVIQKVQTQNASLEFRKLAGLSVEELRDMEETGAQAMPIGKAAARQAAAQYAGASQEIEFSWEVDPELDEKRPHYEVELEHDTLGDLEYKVDAYTGEVFSGPQNILAENEVPQEQITKEQAIEIALEKAGAQNQQMQIRAEKDLDNGRQIWEVELTADQVEYEAEIDAITGEILDWEQDIEHTEPSAEMPDPSQETTEPEEKPETETDGSEAIDDDDDDDDDNDDDEDEDDDDDDDDDEDDEDDDDDD